MNLLQSPEVPGVRQKAKRTALCIPGQAHHRLRIADDMTIRKEPPCHDDDRSLTAAFLGEIVLWGMNTSAALLIFPANHVSHDEQRPAHQANQHPNLMAYDVRKNKVPEP